MFSKKIFILSFLGFVLTTFVGTAQSRLMSPKGYMGLVKIGFLNPMTSNNYPAFLATLQTLHGYRFNPHFALLGGIELNSYDRTEIMPLLVAAKGTLRKKATSPFAMVELGYGFELENDKSSYYSQYETVGGLTFGIEGGMQFPLDSKTIITMSIGYRSQAMGYNEYRSPTFGISTNERVRYVEHNLHVRVGGIF